MDIHEACEYYMQQLEAANQRELELLAVIDDARIALRNHGMYEVADLLFGEPSQALREHEAKIVAEYKQRAEAAEAKLRELEMQEPVGWQNFATGDMSMYRRSENERPLYAKPFPAPKQEEK